jgi:translocation and assembly module TamB
MLIALAVALALLLAAGGWLLGTQGGARAAFALLETLPGAPLRVEGVQGRLIGPLQIDRLTLDSAARLISLENLRIDWRPDALLNRHLHVNSLHIGRLGIALKAKKDDEPARLPDSIALPFTLKLDSARVDTGEVRQGAAAVIRFGPVALNADFDGSRYLLRLERFAARSGSDAGSVTGDFKGEATIATAKPYALRAEMASGGEAVIQQQTFVATGRIGIEGSLAEMTLAADLAMKASTIKGQAVLRPFTEQPIGSTGLKAQNVDLSDFRKDLPQTDLNVDLSVAESGTGKLVALNGNAGLYNEKKIPLVDLRIDFRQQAGQVDFDRIAATLGTGKRNAGTITGKGRYADEALRIDLTLKAIDLRRLDGRMQPTQLAGEVGIRHASGRQEFTVDLTEPLNKQTAALAAHAVLANSSLTVNRVELALGDGRVRASGYVDLTGRQGFSAKGEVARFRLKDVGNFRQLPDLFLNGNFSLRGARQPRLVADLTFGIDDSRLEGQPLQGEGNAQLREDSISISRFRLNAGANQLDIQGKLTQAGGQLTFSLAAPKLEHLGSGFGGMLEANGVASGSFERPRIVVTWSGSNVRMTDQLSADQLQGRADVQIDRKKIFSLNTATVDASARGIRSGEQQLAELSAQMTFSPQPNAPLNLAIRGQGIVAGGVRADSFRVDASGTTAQHTINMAIAEPGQNWSADASGGLRSLDSATQWQGSIERFAAQGRFVARLDAPAQLLLSQQRVQLDRFRLDSTVAYLSIDQFLRDTKGIVTRGSIERLQVAQLLQFAAMEPAIKTDLQLSGDWNVGITDAPSGTMRLRRDRGDIVVQGGRPVALGLHNLEASATASNGQLTMQLRAEGQQLGLIDASGRIALAGGTGRFAPPRDAPVAANININIPSLSWLGPMVSPTTIVEGSVQSAVTVGGTLSAPRLGGRMTGNALRVLSADTGVDLRQGVLESEFQDSRLVIRGLRFPSQDGYLMASGDVNLAEGRPSAQIAVKAERFALLDRSDRRLRISGESRIAWRAPRANITGAFTVNSGFVDIASTAMPKLSDDVVIVGQTQKNTGERGFPADVDVSVSLGEGVALRGRGLDALLAGQVRFVSAAGDSLRAHGTVQVTKGTFSAYGRELDIEQGVLRFNGPLDNPSLDILAMRRGQEVEAGVAVRGTALTPRVSLVSEPSVPEAEKLSWLVLGQGLERVGEGDMGTLQSAAGALLSQGAQAGVQSQIARAFGLDEVSVGTTQDSLQERIVTLGKQVSSRLYVSLERGLETATSVLHLRYTLSPKVTLEAEAGTRSALSVFYNIAFD